MSLKEKVLAQRERVVELRDELTQLHTEIARDRAAISSDLANGLEADYSDQWWADREEACGLLWDILQEFFPGEV